jgi:hypothetical protein
LNEEYRDHFLPAAHDWICDPYTAVIGYVARRRDNANHLLAASLNLHPYALPQDSSFKVETEDILAGILQLTGSKKDLLEIVHKAAVGSVEAHGHQFLLPCDGSYSYFSEFVSGERWYDTLNLRVAGSFPKTHSNPSYLMQCVTDNALRCTTPPFDGLAGLFTWLGLNNPEGTGHQPTIDLRVIPPIDFDANPEVGLRNSCLRLALSAHPKFDLGKFSLAVMPFPGIGVKNRAHLASHVKWSAPEANKRDGELEVPLENADNVEVMLMIEQTTVRRQWKLDPTKADNYRLMAMQHFDPNLTKVKEALESRDGRQFEKGVGALLFLMGFSSALQPETNAPDIIVSTLGGRIVLVECTTRIADFHEKLGKLVDRKAALTKVMQDRIIPPRVVGMLVCGLPKDQIAADVEELREYQVPMLTKEALDGALERVRFHVDPDAVIDEALANLNRPDWLKA